MNHTISLEDLAKVTGGASQGSQLDPSLPLQGAARVAAACGPQLDAYTAARTAQAANPNDARADLNTAATGRALALCATNQGFDPPAAWRHATTGSTR